MALGAYVAGFPKDASALDSFNRLVGTPARMVMWYEGDETASFSAATADFVLAHNATPIITWDPWGSDPKSIIAGTYDAYMHRYLHAVAVWGKRVYLRPMWEMNGNWYAWGYGVNGNTAADLVAAWQHIVDIGREEGASNVRWVWSPNVLPSTGQTWGTPYAQIYPGDSYVDWLGLDGYNSGGAAWRSLLTTFKASYDSITALSAKPLMIAETASAEQDGDKAVWIAQGLMLDLPTFMPRVRAVTWFNINKEEDWRVNSSPASLASFSDVAASQAFSGVLP